MRLDGRWLRRVVAARSAAAQGVDIASHHVVERQDAGEQARHQQDLDDVEEC